MRLAFIKITLFVLMGGILIFFSLCVLSELEASNSLRCQVCGRQFKYKSCLITHMETKHSASLQAANPMQQLASPMVSVNPKVSSLHCEFCGEVFVYHANLMKHKYKVHRELMQSYATASSLSGGSHHATMATTGQTTLPARGDEAKAGGGGSGDIYRGSAFSSYVSAASHSGSLAPGGARGTSPPPVEVKVKKEKEGGGGDEGSQDATPDRKKRVVADQHPVGYAYMPYTIAHSHCRESLLKQITYLLAD